MKIVSRFDFRVLATLLLLTCSLHADSTHAEQLPEDKCGGTTYDESVCLSRVYKQADAALNAEYEKAAKTAARFTEADGQRLKDAELKWIGYRDAHCDAEYRLWGRGSGGPNARERCMIRLTRDRTNELRNVYAFFSN